RVPDAELKTKSEPAGSQWGDRRCLPSRSRVARSRAPERRAIRPGPYSARMMALKLEPRPQLQLARVSDGARNGTGLRIADILIGKSKLRMIRQVEGLRADFELRLFVQNKVL